MYKSWERQITKNKAVDVSVMTAAGIGLGLSLRGFSRDHDHWGIYLCLEFMNVYVEINLYDCRHADKLVHLPMYEED